MDMEFKNLSYTVRKWVKFGPKKKVLQDVNGKFKSGQLSAIMGPSGAGKTCLLNSLSGYRKTGVVGDITENGQPRNIRRFHKMSCYITQEDQIQPLLTVEEAMMVSANLKLPTHLSKMTKMNMIMDILATLNLSETLKSRTEALSGGQKKLLSIALELINNPPVFFLDEPTSFQQLGDVPTKPPLKLLAGYGLVII